ncbi:MUT7 Exonuclease, partial [Oreotrochilus melanogaster]|nr:MUT7 Exonuclease [Oreotrochilus melanogaster]
APGRQELPREQGHHLTSLLLSFFQVCNCDKYLKIPRERMKQLVEDSRLAQGASGPGKFVEPSWSHDATMPACDTAQPSDTRHGEQEEQPGGSVAEGTVLQVGSIPPGVLDRAELTDFYCCSHCGKVFWEGSHFGHVVSQFHDVLVPAGDKQGIYELS